MLEDKKPLGLITLNSENKNEQLKKHYHLFLTNLILLPSLIFSLGLTRLSDESD